MKRLPHKPPPWYLGPRPEAISERYQAEIDLATTRLDKRYRSAQKALARAEKRHLHAERSHAPEAALRARRAEIEQRTAELAEIERLMQPSNTASASHRGVKSYQKVPRR